MHKIKYKTQYVVNFLESIKELKCIVRHDAEAIIINATDRVVIQEVLVIIYKAKLPLTHQIEKGGLEVTLFDPRL